MNLLKGEVPLKAENKEYTLKFTTNALCELEDHLDMEFVDIIKYIDEIINEPSSSSKNIVPLKQVRSMLYCACLQHHKEEVDIEFAGQIIDEAGYFDSWTAVVKAIAACLPDIVNKDKTCEQKKTSTQGK